MLRPNFPIFYHHSHPLLLSPFPSSSSPPHVILIIFFSVSVILRSVFQRVLFVLNVCSLHPFFSSPYPFLLHLASPYPPGKLFHVPSCPFDGLFHCMDVLQCHFQAINHDAVELISRTRSRTFFLILTTTKRERERERERELSLIHI